MNRRILRSAQNDVKGRVRRPPGSRPNLGAREEMQEPNLDEQVEVIAQDGEYTESTESATESHAPKAAGLKIARHFTEPGEDVWSTVEWEKRSAIITGEKGDIVFEQHDIDVPKSWTQLATNVVAS